MDLISREAVLDGIDKYIEKAQSTGTKDDFISFAELGVKGLPSAFEGMTNGEILKALFPNMKVYEYTEMVVLNDLGVGVEFQIQSMAWNNWWNSPYKGVSE